MTDRYMIHVGGGPGSGKSRMSRALVEQFHTSTDLKVEHISLGDQVRALARGAISSSYQEHVGLHLANPHTANERLDEQIILNLLCQRIETATNDPVDVILLDGYPRYEDQAIQYFEIANRFDYQTPGALIAMTTPDTALVRMLKRGQKGNERRISTMQAWDKITSHERNYPRTLHQLSRFAIHNTFDIHSIDTTGEKRRTDDEAFSSAMQLVNRPVPKIA
jgi:adenylate kinase family enzyme